MSQWSERKPIFCDCGDHAFVAITRGLTTMVSPEDAPIISDKWHAQITPDKRARAKRSRDKVEDRTLNGVRTIDLGRAVLGLGKGLMPDHINSDPLDNRRANLRAATAADNARNRRPNQRKSDLPKGVHRNQSGHFQAQIKVKGEKRYLGTFATSAEAHAAYVEAARRFHGEFARAA